MALKGHKSDSGSFLYPLVSSVTFAPGGSGRGVQHHLYEKAVAVRHAPLQPPLHPHPQLALTPSPLPVCILSTLSLTCPNLGDLTLALPAMLNSLPTSFKLCLP